MKPYSKSTQSLEELLKIISSLEMLGMHYRITSGTILKNNEWERCWDIEELEVSL